jgi:hypothetical protein
MAILSPEGSQKDPSGEEAGRQENQRNDCPPCTAPEHAFTLPDRARLGAHRRD